MGFNPTVLQNAVYGLKNRVFFNTCDLERPKYHVVIEQRQVIVFRYGHISDVSCKFLRHRRVD